MGPIEATQSVLSNTFEFSGRASRSEYWWFVAVWTIAYFAVLAIQRGLNKWPEALFIIVTFIPVMSVSFRRLQDAGHSGWWSVAELVAFCVFCGYVLWKMPSEPDPDEAAGEQSTPGTLFVASAGLSVATAALIIWHFSIPSEPGPNEYGPNPHEVTS